jgi:hypothetical protein
MTPTTLPTFQEIATSGMDVSAFEARTYAANQPPYLPLPVLTRKGDPHGQVISRWKLTWRERFHVLLFGTFFISQLTFHKPLQPIKPHCLLSEAFEEIE